MTTPAASAPVGTVPQAPHVAPVLLVGGRVIDPASNTDTIADVAIAQGRVVEIGRSLSRSPAARVIDAKGCVVAPGLVDPHVHLREPGHEYKETIRTGSHAAIAGGFTTVCCMPNTSPALDTPELVRFVLERADGAHCRVYPVAAATKGRKGEELTEIQLLHRAGAVAFSDDGDCVPTAGMMRRVLAAVKQTGRCFMQHCQDPTLTKGATMHAGEVSTRLGLTGWPREAEEIIVERDIRLNRAIKARYHVQHISSGETVDMIRRARAEGQPVTGEASPHHLLLTHHACEGFNTLAKVNPPLREQRDIDLLRAGVADGTITVLATDHAPHSEDEKQLGFDDAPMGMIGLETALALYAEALVRTKLIDWPRLIALLTLEPAKLVNLDGAGIGSLRVGGPADVTIIDPEAAWTIDMNAMHSRSRNTPFHARAARGRVRATIVGGRVAFERGT
ncbi:MAG: dihydroorotase [Planctomycetota bacterium]|nr:dihydroorotase [Planctomycetota bacterium]